MKKSLLLLFTILSCFALKAQQTQITFVATASPIYANETSVTFTAQGENNNLAVNMDVLPSVANNPVMITPNNQGYSGNFSMSNVTRGNYYNPTSGTKSTFSAKVNTSGFGSEATVKFTVSVTFININNSTVSTGTVPLTVTIKPGSRPTTTFYNVAKSGLFTRNDCGTGFVGSQVSYTILAGSYSSTISQADADQKALTYLPLNGQAFANANGTCSIDYSNWFTNWYPPRYSDEINGWDVYVIWNKNLVVTPTVKFEVYQRGVFKGVVKTNVPNTGETTLSFIGLLQDEGNFFGEVKLKIISEADPTIADFSPQYDWGID